MFGLSKAISASNWILSNVRLIIESLHLAWRIVSNCGIILRLIVICLTLFMHSKLLMMVNNSVLTSHLKRGHTETEPRFEEHVGKPSVDKRKYHLLRYVCFIAERKYIIKI